MKPSEMAATGIALKLIRILMLAIGSGSILQEAGQRAVR